MTFRVPAYARAWVVVRAERRAGAADSAGRAARALAGAPIAVRMNDRYLRPLSLYGHCGGRRNSRKGMALRERVSAVGTFLSVVSLREGCF